MNAQDKKITDIAKQLVEAMIEKGFEDNRGCELIQIFIMDESIQVSSLGENHYINIETPK